MEAVSAFELMVWSGITGVAALPIILFIVLCCAVREQGKHSTHKVVAASRSSRQVLHDSVIVGILCRWERKSA